MSKLTSQSGQKKSVFEKEMFGLDMNLNSRITNAINQCNQI